MRNKFNLLFLYTMLMCSLSLFGSEYEAQKNLGDLLMLYAFDYNGNRDSNKNVVINLL